MKNKTSNKTLEQRLVNYPELKNQVIRMIELVEGSDGVIKKADDVEETMIDITHNIGSYAIQGWAES